MNRKGFTLIELLVVVAVLALLASIVFSNLSGAREGARISNALSFQSQTHSLLGSDLVGWWNFNHGNSPPCGAGKVCDISGYNNHGNNNSGTYVDGVPGTGGYSLRLGGFSVPHSEELSIPDNLSIFFWLKLEYYHSSYSETPLEKYGGTSTANWRTYVFGTTTNPGMLTFYANRNGVWGTISSSKILELDRWYHVGLSYRSDIGGQLYIDGNTHGSRTGSGLLHTNTHQVSKSGSSLVVDDVRIYSRALTASEVQTLYAQTKDKYLANE